MADRIHQYPMFSQSLTPNPLQQSQIPQQPQQPQQPDPQMISALSNTEHARMWQQINQLPNAYRQQQSGDLTASQMNHQMQEFARGQALSHPQGQPMVQQIQQSFGLNAQRMNPVFHDSQPSQSQPLMQPNFSNMPMNTQQQIKAPFNMNPMMHGLNNPGVPRQLNMLSQQDMARLQQQSGIQAQRAPNSQPSVDMFGSPSVQHAQDQLHGSPHPSAQAIGPPGPNQGIGPGNPQQKRMITPAEIQERRAYLHHAIQQVELELANLMQNARSAGATDPAVQQQINILRTELLKRRELFTKFMNTSAPALNQQLVNGIPPSNMSHMNPMTHSNSQQPSQTSVTNGQTQPNFVTQANHSVTGPYNISANVPSPMTTQGQGTLNQQIPIQPTHPIGLPNAVPARTTSTPHLMPSGQVPNVMSPNPGNLAAQGGQKVPNQTRQSFPVMPLDKERFDSTYAHFCRSQNITPGPGHRIAVGENRFVDLHQLHVHVMREGGARYVTLRDMWPVIGGRLGIIQFPGNDTEPGRCGPAMAQQLQNAYEQYLQHFENAYILTVKNRAAAVASQLPMTGNPLPMDSTPTAGMSVNSEISSNPRLNQQVIAAAARFAHLSAQDMRAQHLQEPMIAFVERHRPELQRVQQQQVQVLKQREQNLANVRNQLANMHDPSTAGPQVQRPMGMNSTINMPVDDSKMMNHSFLQESVAPAPHRQVPTQEQIEQARKGIDFYKQNFQHRSLLNMAFLQIPDDQRAEYNQVFEQVFKMTSELEPKLPLYFITFRSDDFVRKFVAIVLMVAKQRLLLKHPSPQYIIQLTTLRSMQGQILKLNEEFENRWRTIKASSTPARTNPPSSPTVPPPQSTSQITPVPPVAGRQVSQPQPLPSQTQLQHPPRPQSQSQPNQSQPTLPMKKPFRNPPSPSVQPAAVASPTPPPAASSSAPATNAPTPQAVAGSPQTPKSPPSKAITKAKVAVRGSRKLSTAGKGPATPETAPPVAGVKRPSDDEVATLSSVAPSEAEASNAPSPKKAKTEWDGEMSEALVKKHQEVENVQTDGDAISYYLKELMALTATGNEGLHQDVAFSLTRILADVPVDATALSIHGVGDAGPPPTALSPHLGPSNDAAFYEFFDFSKLEDEDDSKAPTPDLVPSSETNPSPESGSEGDSLGGSPDKNKNEESGTDLLRLGSLKEIDGGESAYYQMNDWKWEGTMPTLDQPWAIFPS